MSRPGHGIGPAGVTSLGGIALLLALAVGVLTGCDAGQRLVGSGHPVEEPEAHSMADPDESSPGVASSVPDEEAVSPPSAFIGHGQAFTSLPALDYCWSNAAGTSSSCVDAPPLDCTADPGRPIDLRGVDAVRIELPFRPSSLTVQGTPRPPAVRFMVPVAGLHGALLVHARHPGERGEVTYATCIP